MKRGRGDDKTKSRKNKCSKKEKMFAVGFINQAIGEKRLEIHEVASFIAIILKKLDLSHKETFRFLLKCSISDPEIISILNDLSLVKLSCHNILMLISTDQTDKNLLINIENALEQDLLDLNEEASLHCVSKNNIFSIGKLKLFFSCRISHKEGRVI
jgi:hypothetical protein